jgi:hypothetical protein
LQYEPGCGAGSRPDGLTALRCTRALPSWANVGSSAIPCSNSSYTFQSKLWGLWKHADLGGMATNCRSVVTGHCSPSHGQACTPPSRRPRGLPGLDPSSLSCFGALWWRVQHTLWSTPAGHLLPVYGLYIMVLQRIRPARASMDMTGTWSICVGLGGPLGARHRGQTPCFCWLPDLSQFLSVSDGGPVARPTVPRLQASRDVSLTSPNRIMLFTGLRSMA